MRIEEIAKEIISARKRALLWLTSDGSGREYRNLSNANEGVLRASLYGLAEFTIGNPEKSPAIICKFVKLDYRKGKQEHRMAWPNDIWRLTEAGIKLQKIIWATEPA